MRAPLKGQEGKKIRG